MLQAIREKAQGWIAWVIVILITIPFALWGIQEYLGVGGEQVVAHVEGQEITQQALDQRTRDFRDRMRSLLGSNYREDQFDNATLKQELRDRMIDEVVLATTAERWNLRAGDVQVRHTVASIPAFQRDGRFDQELYMSALRARGNNPAAFEQSVRQDMVMGQMENAVRDSAFVTDAALADEIRLKHQRRDVSYVRIPAATQAESVVIDSAAARAWYEQNAASYMIPERVKLAYILLDANALADLVDADEDKVREYFDENRDQFVLAEQRAMRHILVPIEDGDEQAALKKAQDLRTRIQAGEDFAALARDNSADPGSAAKGGELGWVSRGMMVGPFEEAGFAAPQGSVTEPVKTTFGYHLIEVTDVRGGTTAVFADVRDKVEKAYRKHAAADVFYDYLERLATITYEDPTNLEVAAERLGLKIAQSGWLNRDQEPPAPLNSPKVMNLAFSDDVLGERHNSDVVELSDTSAVVFRVVEHESEQVRPFEEVRERVLVDARAAKAAEATAARGKAALDRLVSGGTDLQGIAAAQSDVELVAVGPIGRDQRGQPAEVVDAAFAMAPPGDRPGYTGRVSAEGDYFLIAVKGVAYADMAQRAADANATARNALAKQLAAGDFGGLVDALRADAVIELEPLGDD